MVLDVGAGHVKRNKAGGATSGIISDDQRSRQLEISQYLT